MFSIFRYAIPIEAIVSILIPSLTVVALRNLLGRTRMLAEVLVCIGVSWVIWQVSFADSWGRVKYSDSVFSIGKVSLPADSLMVIADDPLSFLAPILAETNPTLRFVGVPRSGGALSGFEGKEDSLIAKRVSSIIHAAHGNVYIAYYQQSQPYFPWLSAMGVGPDYGNCNIISSNVSPDIMICKARLIVPESSISDRFKVDADVKSKNNVMTSIKWVSNDCIEGTRGGSANAIAQFYWKVGKLKINKTAYYIQEFPEEQRLFSISTDQGEAVTGNWVTAGQTFTLRDADGAELASVYMRYVPCE